MPTSKGFTLIRTLLRRNLVNVHGFTLIELLVVISIIAILSVVGIVSYTGFLKNSRDARRQADLKFIQSALEQFHADQLYYPDQDSLTFGSALTFTNASGDTKTYLTKVPNDPSGSLEYSYIAEPSGCNNTSCTSYCLYAGLEGTNRPASDSGCAPASPYNYGVTRP